MSDKKSKWALWGLGLACAACCAMPIYLLLGGTAVVGAMSAVFRELLICLLPLMVLGLVVYFIAKRKKSCCDLPQSNCNDLQCGVKNHD